MVLNPLSFQFPGVPRVHCLFFLKTQADAFAGNLSYEVGDDPARVTAVRAEVCAAFASAGLERIVCAHQVHGDTLLFEPSWVSDGTSALPEADGLASGEAHLGLLIKTADCQPLLLTDTSGTAICALHIGWRANRCGFIQTAVQRFCAHYGLRACDLLAVRGPSLSPLRAEFVNFAREWGDAFRPWYDTSQKTMDLWGLTRAQLAEAGLPERNIFGIDLCTMSNATCASYRRDRTCGRLGGLIWLA